MIDTGSGDTDVLVVSGAGAYADPWHPFRETSGRLASLVAEGGHSVRAREDVEAALADPGRSRLLIVNIGNPSTPQPGTTRDAIADGIHRHLASGGALLGVHVSATSLTDWPGWPGVLGGRWIRGQSMHPAQDTATIEVTAAGHPITRELADFEVHDERYSYLAVEPDATVLYEHAHDGRHHPLVWAREHNGARVVYDGLGHDTTSYDSPGHQALLRRAVAWLLRE